MDYIKIKGAKEHNLKNIDINIPKNKLVIFTGVSGSGKTSLAMDTIYAEGQRRYVESLSSYARQFLGVLAKPNIEYIEGLSPAIAIDQKTTSHNPRSTVGTVTEIYDYLRVLFARIGRVYDPSTGEEIKRQSPQEITDSIISLIKNDKDLKIRPIRFFIISPIVRGRKGEYSHLLKNLHSQGYQRVRIDGSIYNLTKPINLIKTNKHTIEVIVDRVVVGNKTLKDNDLFNDLKTRLFHSVETALRLSEGLVTYSKILDNSLEFPESPEKTHDILFSEEFAFKDKNIEFPNVEPRLFSFNTPYGACPNCSGLGTILKFDESYFMNTELSIMEGGIFPLGNIAEKETWFKRKLNAVSKKEGINLFKPINKIPKNKLNILLYGSNAQYKVSGTNLKGNIVSFKFIWPGIISELQRKYKETESDFVKKELERYMVKEICPVCKGTRLKKESLFVKINNFTIADVANLPIKDAYDWINSLMYNNVLTNREQKIGQPLIKEISLRLEFLINVGLDYLTLSRGSNTLAGGEAQRIRLASQIGSGLSGVLYVLDEPSIGLHATDQSRLVITLKKLRELGNSVLVVEHDAYTMLESDYILDFGPGAGEHGGTIIAKGTPEQIMKNPKSITGSYLSGKRKIDPLQYLSNKEKEYLKKLKNTSSKYNLILKGACGHNLKNVTLSIPLGKMICVTGVSGSGKSTLINETLLKALREEKGLKNDTSPLPFKEIINGDKVDKIINIDQSPIGRTPRSNPATYTKAFDEIRKLFSLTKDARIRGYKSGRFSFNVKGGRCEACKGDGQLKIEMQFMPDVYVTCEVCEGKRYTNEVLDIFYKGKNISDVLDMSVSEALKFFSHNTLLQRKLGTLEEVGLGYIKLGQPATTLSGGEAQRVKLASELSKMQRGHSLYILDEPTTGLHFSDLERLIAILKKLVAKGNTVLVIEHNLDVIKNADWIIDLGPLGGERGGEIIFEGTVDNLKKSKKSKTGLALRELDY